MVRDRGSGRRTAGRRREAARTARARGRRTGRADVAAAAAAERSDRPAIGYQRWDELLFLHWPVPPAAVRALVDPRLELDLLEGHAWISLTPFTVKDARLRGLPPLPPVAGFDELNLRTYVAAEGVPGVWFFSLDAASAAAAAIARATLGLPYFRARMARSASGRVHEYRSERLAPGPGPATFEARWSVGERAPSAPRSTDRFLCERYALYTAHAGALLRVRVRHAPWVLHGASVEHLQETVTRAAGLELTSPPALARFSPGVDVEVLAPEPVSGRR
jgi:uncharacterized protein YqjF (DUF2071 family)